MVYSYSLCLCGETANKSGLCPSCEQIRDSLRPDPQCPHCGHLQKLVTVVSCACIANNIDMQVEGFGVEI